MWSNPFPLHFWKRSAWNNIQYKMKMVSLSSATKRKTISNFYAAVFFFFSRGFKTQWSALWVDLHGSSIFNFFPSVFITHAHTFICFSVSQSTLHVSLSLSLSVKHLTAALFWWSMASVKIQWEAISLDHRYRDQLMKPPTQPGHSFGRLPL